MGWATTSALGGWPLVRSPSVMDELRELSPTGGGSATCVDLTGRPQGSDLWSVLVGLAAQRATCWALVLGRALGSRKRQEARQEAGKECAQTSRNRTLGN